MTTPMPDPPGPDLSAILSAAQRGDEQAWSALVDAYWRRVYALVRSRCKDEELAEEVTQSVFVTVAEQLGKGTYQEQGRFEPWIFRVAMNRLRDEFRRAKRQAEPTDPATFQNASANPRIAQPDGEHSDSKPLAALRHAITQLTSADRDIIELRHHASLSFKQIAEVLNEPVGTVLARHHRALRKLKSHIESASTETST